ncbi:HPr family phosphocarrier protein [Catonella massiliensis]|jgi:phosphocarrier,  HPr family|uniref:HPr family phosphocarrier protein n=1 Tax=Catonella massiliensis TaxID=2799636 RepID=A0ABS1J1R7_9FIRM|nr:HPr family phosphocarrier protein [Catonella massiliensis]MBK5898091.1 HPr family phosphocarrier protein [Catonella massiliensis]
MKKINYTVVAEAGIHARPAGLLVKQAASFKSDIKLLNEENGKEADLKRLMAVMALGVKQGNRIVVTVEGEDEDEAYTVLESFLKENF